MTASESTPVETIDLDAVMAYRQAQLRKEMGLRNIDAVILTDAVNIRYATGTRNMQIFTSRNPASRYCFLPVEGDVVMFEFTGTEHLSEGLATVQEVRHARTASFVAAGPKIAEVERLWAADMIDLITERCGLNATVGVERVNAGAATALAASGLTIVDAQEPVERARAIKSPGELACIRASLRATEAAMHHMQAAIAPGLTENELWSIFHQHVIAAGADYIETRLMTAGSHTNPWFQETSDHVIEPDVLIAFDTDVVGVHGYYSDFSRTFHVGPSTPTARQRELYRFAHDQVHHNMDIIEPGMTLCVESYIGAQGEAEGVKLEQQILVTETGTELLSQFPFEDDLL